MMINRRAYDACVYALQEHSNGFVLFAIAHNTHSRITFEAFFIAKTRPAFNAHVQHYYISLFQNGFT